MSYAGTRWRLLAAAQRRPSTASTLKVARTHVDAVDVATDPVRPASKKQHSLKSWLSSQYDKDIFSLAVPAALALAADPLLGMVDTALVGRLGSEELVSSPHLVLLPKNVC